MWLGLTLVMVLEFLYFDRQTSRHYAWVYPRWNDQIQYLGEVYRGHDVAVRDGLVSGIAQTATKPSAQGLLTAVAGVALFEFTGASRSAALALNMLAWLALQGVVFAFVLRRFGSAALAWLAFGLLLLWHTPFAGGPGSAWDFRLDFIAACLFGITLVAAQRTDGFLTWGRSLVFGLCVGLTLLERFLTGTYFAVIFFGFAVWVLCLPHRGRRLLNLLLAGVVAALLAGPFFWINRLTVWEYYFLGHFSGPERAIRDSHLGLLDSAQWALSELFHSHLNAWFVSCALAVTALLTAGAMVARRRAPSSPPKLWSSVGWMPASLFFFAPFLILTQHDEKSYVTISVLVPPLLLLVIEAWVWLAARGASVDSAGGRTFAGWLAAAVMATGLVHFVVGQIKPNYDAGFAIDARALNHFADQISATSRQAALDTPRVAVDQVTDSMDGQVLRVICYERQHVWQSFIMTLPTGIMAEKPALLMERIAESDFVILHADASDGIYPFDHEMTQMLPVTTAWCDNHLRVAERFRFFGRAWTLYAKASVVGSVVKR